MDMASKQSRKWYLEICSMTRTKSNCRRGKSDLILDVTLRSEKLLQDMNNTISTFMHMQAATRGTVASPQTSSSSIAADSIRQTGGNHGAHEDDISNAMISSFHQSTTEAVLAWSIFDTFPTLCSERSNSFFSLEKSRVSLPERTKGVIYPYLPAEDVGNNVLAFQKNINFWYPVMSNTRIRELEAKVNAVDLNPSIGSCLALLLMALGCASESIAAVYTGSEVDAEETDLQGQKRSLSEIFFDGALKMIHFAQMETSAESTQCLFYTA